ncbi:MAG: ABC transporter permease [Actinomycetota bacterium]|nr:ABC transporter permease [Actinomycetota bacterium]
MTGLWVAALAVESRKLAASWVVRGATLLLVGGIAVLAIAMNAAAEAGNEQIVAQLGDLANEDGWTRLIGVAAQIAAAATVLGFGVVLAWSVGREFADGTISGLFALPVSRPAIVLAKLFTVLAWAIVVAVLLVAVVAAAGLVGGEGAPDGAALGGLVRLFVLVALSAMLAVPAAWVATLGRGLLAGIATTIVTIATAQVMAVAGVGAWFPVAAPALWSLDPDTVSPPQLALVAVIPLAFGALTLHAWSRLQLDR